QLFSRVPLEILSKDAHHIRIFTAHPTFNIALRLPNLVEPSILKYQYPGDFTSDADGADGTGSEMVALNPHVQKLPWTGPEDAHPLLTEPLMDLSCPTHLQLGHWQGSGDALKRVLDVMASTLTSLRLYSIQGVERHSSRQRAWSRHRGVTSMLLKPVKPGGISWTGGLR
ncbi:hypothetical protein BG011_009984, partial [Mortierella polycephala]